MSLSHYNSAWMILYIFLVFSCTMFPNTSLVEINFPQNLDRFQAVVCGKFFIVTWMDSIIERSRFSCMVKRAFIRFIFISSQISSFCGCRTDFSEFMVKSDRVKLFPTNYIYNFFGKTPTRKIPTRMIPPGQFQHGKLPPKKILTQDNSHPDNSHPENSHSG